MSIIQIIKRYARVERWSAYDTDQIYYVEVVDDRGEKYVFSDFHPLTENEIKK
ncbi:MAG: hypothetical protein ACQEXX_01220 [Bacillota bacterium]